MAIRAFEGNKGIVIEIPSNKNRALLLAELSEIEALRLARSLQAQLAKRGHTI